MAENTIDYMLQKKNESYSTNLHDFVADGEITVTITLSEYRDLVSFKANGNAKLSEMQSRMFKSEQNAEKLEEKVKALESAILEKTLKNKMAEKESEE